MLVIGFWLFVIGRGFLPILNQRKLFTCRLWSEFCNCFHECFQSTALNPYLHTHYQMRLQTVSVIAFIIILNCVYYAGNFLSLSTHCRKLLKISYPLASPNQ